MSAAPSSYAQAVAANLAHMGTPAAEWAACPFTLSADIGGKVCPSTTFPSGYSPAPTMFAGGVDPCCGLCGHRIKNVYWLQNDAKRWTLPVGSECVEHFAGVSGEEVRDASERALAIDTLTWMADAFAACRGTPYGWVLAGACRNMLERCDNVSTDPLAWMRRNKAGILKAARAWTRACATPGFKAPRPPECWLPENLMPAPVN